jgi:ribosome biogenesis GTPase
MMIRGQVIRSQSGFYTVQTDAGEVICQLRGRLKKGPRLGDIAAIGDWAQISLLSDIQGMIEEIEPRQCMLSRLAPTPRGVYQQVILANPDQAVFVFSCARPEPHLGMLDRFLVITEKQRIPSLIIASKVDLVGIERAQELFGHYPGIGYPVVYVSTLNGMGIEQVKEHLLGKVSVLAGPSGVGKSSILNVIQPGLGLIVREISQASAKGKHTTVVRQMFPLDGGGFVADTPGLKALALWDMQPYEIDGYFPEMRDLVSLCQYSDCTHIHEPDCAIQQALNDGRIHPYRYESYVRMRSGQEED